MNEPFKGELHHQIESIEQRTTALTMNDKYSVIDTYLFESIPIMTPLFSMPNSTTTTATMP